MICITVAQESRRLALADMLNAARQCDLLEVRLDRFGKSPEIGELLTHKPKPLILSCRRPRDGGNWDGTEEERLALLRQCIVAKADYVEIELDVADQIRRFPPAKRVISYTNLAETPTNIAEIYAQAQTKNPDVIKLTTLARTPEEAWPLLPILAKPALPTVVIGLGKTGVMLSVLGKKIGAPWTYAALERGMEAFPGQATVRDLNEVYHYPAINKTTRLIGVTGFGPRETATVSVLNAVLAHLKVNARCLPLGVGSVPLFRKVMDAVHLGGVVVDPEHQGSLASIATKMEPAAEEAAAVDLLLPRDKGWLGHNSYRGAAVTALEEILRKKTAAEHPLQGRMVMIVGISPLARSIALQVKQRGGVIIFASHEKKAAQQLAQSLECRYVQFEGLYTTMHEILIVCDEEKEHAKSKGPEAQTGIHTGYLHRGMAVMDLTAEARMSPLLREAQERGCPIVAPRQILREHLAIQARLITGVAVPSEALDSALDVALPEEE
jgi:3-dehydroquinate dehydratase/shikimate dehydrogenase